MNRHGERSLEFRRKLDELIDEYWSDICPDLSDDDYTAEEIEELEGVMPTAWTILVGTESMEFEGPSYQSRFSKPGQSPLVTSGLLS